MRARQWENSSQGHSWGGYLELADTSGEAGERTPNIKLPYQDYSPWRLLFNLLLQFTEVSFKYAKAHGKRLKLLDMGWSRKCSYLQPNLVKIYLCL